MEQVNIAEFRRQHKKTSNHIPVDNQHYRWSKLKELFTKDLTFGGSHLNDQKKDHFFFELSTLLQSGIDLKNSLDLVTLESLKDKHLGIYKEIKEKVINGESLARAVKGTGKFSDYDFFSIEIGEETGNLAEVLKDLAVYYKRKVEQRRKIVAALTYPAIVLCTSAAAVFFMLRFVVPMFSDVFKRFGGKLPWMTDMVIRSSKLMGALFLPGVLVLGLLISFLYANRNKHRFRDLSSRLVLKIPLIGELVTKIYLARFCNTMRLLISTKIPLLRAIAMSRHTIGFYPVEQSLKKVELEIMAGKSLHLSLQEFSIYPPKMIQLVKVGEEINKLDYFFENIADQYVKEVEHQTSTVSKLIEPLIIIFLGLVVGFILISMYLPMFEMGNSF
ncbi:type II secretion system F family protein [Pedobacter psychroterrae]|uniref:General secretion pathway protein F n=1 Tax=Pedobacter psychroterrae TaxID=2530453 RepID=A0A4R0NIY2_9SPHI|nr:type II secretion system F family protein [Pedobacter psychroterrae]TCC99767.1 type II secretion system F family protein [Pedobacter psychroterrae]